MEFQNLIYESSGAIAVVTINRPKVLNALNKAVLQELDQAFAAIAEMREIAVVIVTGAGEKSFVAGADIAEMSAYGIAEARAFSRLGQQVFNRIEELPQPVIAAVNGYALGGGCELAMACDFRIAAQNARFGQPEVSLGVIAGFGGTQRLPRLVGRGMAAQLLYSGDMIGSDEALRIGLVNKVVAAEALMDEAKAIAGRIAAAGPLSVIASKAALREGSNMDLKRALAYERELFAAGFATADQKEGMAAFLQKRKANFQGR
ncbi:3-hydroxybutyryl-coa dehydratase [Heliomicrobium modesticaldum Ice1]|uniref:short-chain-enoyl-CoA hydratase n=1 Tax=Heliobacterium modesticaldum (strain ATCC 51547 / Ice1) TaxID=498761 RepID=B0TAM0_HELMI|nr:enoyl-CoA hydratase-related protein [Heliomicrobium modesticaldum]ABZ83672.1 3-hydroxybutyryl-coa dehydratase [Heliomicrobium modesticaldum Ice1]